MQQWAERFYKSRAWESCRDSTIRRDAYLCQDCLKAGRITPALEVHHIIPLTPHNITDPNVTLNPGNLISLCKACHAARHKVRPRRYVILKDGRVQIADPPPGRENNK